MSLPHVNPAVPSSTGTVTCTCGRIFKSGSALQQHQRDSPLHSRINRVKGNSGMKCSCGKTVKDENGLKEHIRDSSRHHKLEEFCAAAGTGTMVGHILGRLEGERVEDGLQGKGKLLESQQYVNFRNEDTFPTFSGLPGDDDINLAFYNTRDGFSYVPRKHWCFLAEIIDIELFIRVHLIVRDKAGTTVRVAFHTDGRGTEFTPSQLQPGYTVAILYAHQHTFLDLRTGIRQEEYCTVKIIPVALAELLQLSDRVHEYCTELDDKRTCHGCNERKNSLQKCAKCSLFSYCNKSCQATGWNNGGHKRDCKLIRDNDIRAMFLLEWDHFENFIRFPLQSTTSTGGQVKTGHVQLRKHQVEEALQSKPVNERGDFLRGCDYPTGTVVEASKNAEEAQQSNEHINHNSGEERGCTTEPSLLEKFLEGHDFGSMSDVEPMHQMENFERKHLKNEMRKQTSGAQKSRELGGIQKYIKRQREAAREKATARAKESRLKMTSLTRPSANNSAESFPDNPTKQQGIQETGTAEDSTLIRRCLRSAIPSIAATTGTDILELINLDILNEHLGLNIDLFDAWQRLLGRGAASENIEAFLGECATDPYAWSILRREGYFRLNIWRIIQNFEEGEKRRNKNREYLIDVLEALREALENVVEWEIVPDRVPRAVMRIAIAVAKEGPDPPGIDAGDEGFQIDPFLALVADKSESSLFGTPDSDNPRYWDYWMRREGFGSDSS